MYSHYHPRPVSFLGTDSVAGHKLKLYAIHPLNQSFVQSRFTGAWDLALPALPPPDELAGRPGVGFAILCQGAIDDYFVLCWWDRQNKLPTRVYVRGPEGWRSASGSESFGIWDLWVIWWEREAYIATMLEGHQNGPDVYLATIIEGYA